MSENADPTLTLSSGRLIDRSSPGLIATSGLPETPDFTKGNGKLDSITFDDLLRRQRPLDTGRFDLNDVTFVAPSGLVDLAVAVTTRASSAGSCELLVADHEVRTYLARIRFCQLLSSVAVFNPPIPAYVLRRSDLYEGASESLVELTRLTSLVALPILLGRIIRALTGQLGYADDAAKDVAIGISETVQNSFDHNPAIESFLAMQVYGSGERRFLEIAMGDAGQGIRATLSQNPAYSYIASDVLAIQRSLERGVSASSDLTRGTGLFHLRDLTRKLSGSLEIRSGSAKVRMRADRPRATYLSVPAMAGVQVTLGLPTQRATMLT
jgi:hypothetical protein